MCKGILLLGMLLTMSVSCFAGEEKFLSVLKEKAPELLGKAIELYGEYSREESSKKASEDVVNTILRNSLEQSSTLTKDGRLVLDRLSSDSNARRELANLLMLGKVDQVFLGQRIEYDGICGNGLTPATQAKPACLSLPSFLTH